MAISYSSIGFIGLGTMGLPMVENLLKKTGPTVKIHIYDVSEAAILNLAKSNEERIHACTSSMEVAQKSVREEAPRKQPLLRPGAYQLTRGTEHHPDHGTRRLARPQRLLVPQLIQPRHCS